MEYLQEDSGFLTLAEAAARLRVSTHTVYKMCRTGDIPARRVGRQWRIRIRDLEDWLAHQSLKASARPGGSGDPLENI
jgi:excisionase family DNA binding protein